KWRGTEGRAGHDGPDSSVRAAQSSAGQPFGSWIESGGHVASWPHHPLGTACPQVPDSLHEPLPFPGAPLAQRPMHVIGPRPRRVSEGEARTLTGLAQPDLETHVKLLRFYRISPGSHKIL